jgi:hypothetical protein
MDILFEHVDSYSELREYIRQNPTAILLGAEDESHSQYYRCHIFRCKIGICSQHHGIAPCYFLDEEKEIAWIGYNSKIANIDLSSCEKRFVLELDTVIYTIIDRLPDGSVIVVYELGACRISGSGQVLWNYLTDVVTSFSTDEDYLLLQTDEEEITIDKERGLRQ